MGRIKFTVDWKQLGRFLCYLAFGARSIPPERINLTYDVLLKAIILWDVFLESPVVLQQACKFTFRG